MRPGYGVVEKNPGSASGGSLQQRDLNKPEFAVGENVLLTNAGDVVRD